MAPRNQRAAVALICLGRGILFAAAVVWMFGCELRAQTGSIAPAMHTNRLIHEKSPYLLQHAHNPVDWFPWGDEAFAKAKREDKPIFLSIGYSTCYWCHVMEKEDFEDAEVARVMNENYVAIKVDREERPDIDEQYMLATQLVTGGGGWPNSLWLTPDGKPWMAGTYFPKAQFLPTLTQLADVWKKRRDDVNKQADELSEAIAKAGDASALAGGGTSAGAAELQPDLVGRGVAALVSRFDARHGGFGDAPKFPPHGTLALLLRRFRDTNDEALLAPITQTLDAMWFGGMHDHIGGGFHRYSTDVRWLVPHFEKMLYDNAQLMRNYTDGFLATHHERFRAAVGDIFRWLQREMTSPEGAFYSAIDAGEVGKEGDAYVWRADQITKVLGADDAALFAAIYNFEKDGNFVEQSTGRRTGSNIPHLTKPIEDLARERSEKPKDFAERVARMRDKLLAERETWPQPRKDDKILTSWNGLMIAALAHAGRALDEPRYTQAATRAADFILRTMMRDSVDAGLLHTYRDGLAKLPGYLDDYAYFVDGLIELHRATGDTRWLEQAEKLANVMLRDFQDEKTGGFFFTAANHDALLLRSKNLGGGGNIPDANGVAAQILLELAELTGKTEYRAAAQRTLESLAGAMERSPFSSEHLLLAAEDYFRGTSGGTGSVRSVASTDDTEVVPPSEDLPDATARADAVSIHARASRASVKPGESFQIAVTLDIDDGWHLYAENPDADFLIPTTVSIEPVAGISVGSVERPEPHRALDPVLKQQLNTYTGRVEFRVSVRIKKAAPPGVAMLTLKITTQACDASRCLQPQTTTLRIPLRIDSEASKVSRE